MIAAEVPGSVKTLNDLLSISPSVTEPNEEYFDVTFGVFNFINGLDSPFKASILLAVAGIFSSSFFHSRSQTFLFELVTFEKTLFNSALVKSFFIVSSFGLKFSSCGNFLVYIIIVCQFFITR